MGLVNVMANWCDGCGICCMHMRMPPLMPDEFHALSDELTQELTDYELSPRYQFHYLNGEHDSPCIWLDLATGKCKHYELRPGVCRDFEVGNQSCRLLRKEVGLTVHGMPVVIDA